MFLNLRCDFKSEWRSIEYNSKHEWGNRHFLKTGQMGRTKQRWVFFQTEFTQHSEDQYCYLCNVVNEFRCASFIRVLNSVVWKESSLFERKKNTTPFFDFVIVYVVYFTFYLLLQIRLLWIRVYNCVLW